MRVLSISNKFSFYALSSKNLIREGQHFILTKAIWDQRESGNVDHCSRSEVFLRVVSKRMSSVKKIKISLSRYLNCLTTGISESNKLLIRTLRGRNSDLVVA